MKKKLLALVLAAAMIATSVAGCGSKPAEETPSASEETAADEAEVAEEEEELTLKIWFPHSTTLNYMDPNEMPAMKEVYERTGVKVEWELIPYDENYSTKVNLAFASGDYPDMIYGNVGSAEIIEYGVNQGILVALDEELIEKNMPAYSKLVAEEPSNVNMSLKMSDGKQYSLGRIYSEGDILYNVYYMNQDWLDAVGKEAPTSLDELTEVLRAFKTGDPNGNGEADEIPLCVSLKKWTDPQSLLALFGMPLEANTLWLYVDDNKELVYAPQQEAFRECMEWLNMLYEEGLVDPEVLSQDGTAIDAKVNEGTVGMFTSWNVTNMGYTDEIIESSICWTPFEGTKAFRNPPLAQHAVTITDKCKDVEAALQWLDTMADPEIMMMLRYGEQDPADGLRGWGYDENGKFINFGEAREVRNAFAAEGFVFATPTFLKENAAFSSDSQHKIDACATYEDAGVIQKYSNKYITMGQMSNEDSQRVALLKTDLDTAVQENMASFITNGVTDDSWNSFMKQLDEIGAQEYIKIYTDSFATVNIE